MRYGGLTVLGSGGDIFFVSSLFFTHMIRAFTYIVRAFTYIGFSLLGGAAREGFQYLQRRKLYLSCFLLSLASLMISVQDKFTGFASGDDGYQATVGDSTGLLATISSNTIFVSFLEGNYVRAAVYLIICSLIFIFLLKSFLSENAKWYRFVFLAGMPVMFFEGLGVIALLVPLLMMIAGVAVSPDYRLNKMMEGKMWT